MQNGTHNILERLFGSRKFVASLLITVLTFVLVLTGHVEAQMFMETMAWVWVAFVGGTAAEDIAEKLRTK